MIEVVALSRRYGMLQALDDVSFTVHAGEIVGLLGANGAGKSTLLRTAAGLQTADSGEVRIGGFSLTTQPLEARRRLGYAAEEPGFHEELSAGEHIAFVAGVRGMDAGEAQERALALAQRLGLADRMNEPVRGYSHGMRKKTSFLAAVLHRPAALLCDEALEGFDAGAALEAKQELRALARAGSAVLFSSHVTETMERLCDRVVLLDRGRVQRTLTRDDWGGESERSSPLELAFLAMVRERAPQSSTSPGL